jgi:hypothetical protein
MISSSIQPLNYSCNVVFCLGDHQNSPNPPPPQFGALQYCDSKEHQKYQSWLAISFLVWLPWILTASHMTGREHWYFQASMIFVPFLLVYRIVLSGKLWKPRALFFIVLSVWLALVSSYFEVTICLACWKYSYF